MSKFYNASLNKVNKGGGSQRLTLTAGVGQGTSQACKFCRVQAHSTNTEVVRIRIDTAVTDGLTGIELPGNPVLTPYTISDLNQLYFYSADANAIIDIEWFD